MVPTIVLFDSSFDDGNENDQKQKSKNDGAKNKTLGLLSVFERKVHFALPKKCPRAGGMQDGNHTWKTRNHKI